MTRQETLYKLEAVLESFLERAATLEMTQVAQSRNIQLLGDIARDSLRGRHINNRLGDWFAHNQESLEQGRLTSRHLSAIGNFLGDIKTGLDNADPESARLAEEIDRWAAKGAKPVRKIVLRRAPESPEADLGVRFDKLFEDGKAQMEYYREKKMHLLTMLDDLLKSAEAKSDLMYLHLAASIIYFLKVTGYKIDPYVKRLKTIEKARLGTKDDG